MAKINPEIKEDWRIALGFFLAGVLYGLLIAYLIWGG